jgi:hypothetical protein
MVAWPTVELTIAMRVLNLESSLSIKTPIHGTSSADGGSNHVTHIYQDGRLVRQHLVLENLLDEVETLPDRDLTGARNHYQGVVRLKCVLQCHWASFSLVPWNGGGRWRRSS